MHLQSMKVNDLWIFTQKEDLDRHVVQERGGVGEWMGGEREKREIWEDEGIEWERRDRKRDNKESKGGTFPKLAS